MIQKVKAPNINVYTALQLDRRIGCLAVFYDDNVRRKGVIVKAVLSEVNGKFDIVHIRLRSGFIMIALCSQVAFVYKKPSEYINSIYGKAS